MSLSVNPAELDSSAARVAEAAAATSNYPGAASEIGDIASKLTYQPTVGMAEAVAQKAGSTINEASRVFAALGPALLKAAEGYRAADRAVHAAVGGDRTGD